MKDILGYDIVIGCFVAYPCKHGSCTWLTVAEVRDIDTQRGKLTVMPVCDSICGTRSASHTNLTSVDHCVVVRNTVVNVRPFTPVSVPVGVREEEGHPLL